MSNIRIRRWTPEGWEMDCFVLPTDITNGELVNFRVKKIWDFRDITEPGLFAALDGLLDLIVPEADIPKAEFRMVIGRLRAGKHTYYHFAASDKYQPTVPEAEVWPLVDVVFEKCKKEFRNKWPI